MPTNVWNYKLQLGDLFHNDDMRFEQRRDAIVARIKASRFYDADDLVLDDILYELAGAQEPDDFDGPWSWFYDYADMHRIWVETIRTRTNA